MEEKILATISCAISETCAEAPEGSNLHNLLFSQRMKLAKNVMESLYRLEAEMAAQMAVQELMGSGRNPPQ